MRKRTKLTKELHIDVVKIGRQIILQQRQKQLVGDVSDLSELVKEEFEPDEEACKHAFNTAIRKIEQVRNISSPILKVIQIARYMDEILGVMGETGEIQDADIVFNMIFYVLVVLKSEQCSYLGARFVEECSYIDSFMHEDQVANIQQYAYIQHLKTALGIMIRGETACIKNFIEQDNGEEEDDCDYSPVDFIIQLPKLKQEKQATITGSSVL